MCRPACVLVHSGQCLCSSLISKYVIKTCFLQNSNILTGLCRSIDWRESYLFENPEDRVSLVAAHFGINFIYFL